MARFLVWNISVPFGIVRKHSYCVSSVRMIVGHGFETSMLEEDILSIMNWLVRGFLRLVLVRFGAGRTRQRGCETYSWGRGRSNQTVRGKLVRCWLWGLRNGVTKLDPNHDHQFFCQTPPSVAQVAKQLDDSGALISYGGMSLRPITLPATILQVSAMTLPPSCDVWNQATTLGLRTDSSHTWTF